LIKVDINSELLQAYWQTLNPGFFYLVTNCAEKQKADKFQLPFFSPD